MPLQSPLTFSDEQINIGELKQELEKIQLNPKTRVS